MNKLQVWNYDESVEWMKPRISKWVDMWDEIEPELIIAKQETSSQGARTDLTSGTNSRGWGQYCKDIGITKRWANKLIAKTELESILGSTGFECYTPAKYVESAREVMGGIDIDPASSEQANETIKATTYLTIDNDGLTYDWIGRVWLNPPYGRSLTSTFVEYAINQYNTGNTTEAIILLNAYGFDAKWFQDLFNHILCFTNHRLKFYGGGPTFGSVFAYLGNNKQSFAKEFSQYGAVMERYRDE